MGRIQQGYGDQLATISKKRLGSRLGRLSAAEMRAAERAIRAQLGLGL